MLKHRYTAVVLGIIYDSYAGDDLQSVLITCHTCKQTVKYKRPSALGPLLDTRTGQVIKDYFLQLAYQQWSLDRQQLTGGDETYPDNDFA